MADLTPFTPPQGSLRLADDANGAAGIACLQQIRPGVGEIKRMYVRPEARGAGIGRALLAGVLQDARAASYQRVRLDSVRFMHAAHSLYRSAGFVERAPYEESEIPPEFWSRWIFMELDLDSAAPEC